MEANGIDSADWIDFRSLIALGFSSEVYFIFLHIDERMHHYQRRRTSITELGL